MTELYLLDKGSEVFQTFQDVNQLFGFAQRSTRNFRGRVLVVRNGNISRCQTLGSESPKEVYDIALTLLSQIR
jgi:hypothetical protein